MRFRVQERKTGDIQKMATFTYKPKKELSTAATIRLTDPIQLGEECVPEHSNYRLWNTRQNPLTFQASSSAPWCKRSTPYIGPLLPALPFLLLAYLVIIVDTWYAFQACDQRD